MVNPETTLVIILGASEWPYCHSEWPDLRQASHCLKQSADSFREYLLSPGGFGLPSSHLKNLFNSDLESVALIEDVSGFLKDRCDSNKNLSDLIIYYVGHGGFSRNHDFFLAIRRTRSKQLFHSSIPFADLATALKENRHSLRQHLIIDCCFAAAAYTGFQDLGGPLQVVVNKIENSLPSRGTGLLCSSGRDDESYAPLDLGYTMFSWALLDALKNGDPSADNFFSLQTLYDVIRLRIDSLCETKYSHFLQHPEIHAPEQREGSIINIPLFKNPRQENLSTKGLHDRLKHYSLYIKTLESQRSELSLYLQQFSKGIRDAICFNQGEYIQYTFLAGEAHKVLRIAYETSPHDISIVHDTCMYLENILNRNMERVSQENFKFIKNYFSGRHPIEPRVCIKVPYDQDETHKLVIQLFRDRKVNYLSEYPLEANSGFWTVKRTGRWFLSNNIPKEVAQNLYLNDRLDYTAVKEYDNQKSHKADSRDEDSTYGGASGFEYDQKWIACWKKPVSLEGAVLEVDPTSCYKSTLIVPMTLWNNKLDEGFREVINKKLKIKIKEDEISRIIFGYLCIDHVEEEYFNKKMDIDIGYMFADMLSLYLMTRLIYTDLSETFCRILDVTNKSIERGHPNA
jgi:hypothetical protein